MHAQTKTRVWLISPSSQRLGWIRWDVAGSSRFRGLAFLLRRETRAVVEALDPTLPAEIGVDRPRRTSCMLDVSINLGRQAEPADDRQCLARNSFQVHAPDHTLKVTLGN